MRIPGVDQYGDLTIVRRHGDTLVTRGVAADGQRVLIKTHAQNLPTDETRARFRREYDSTSAATHPHLEQVRELIDEPGRVALVLVDAGPRTLQDRLAAQDVSPAEVVSAAADIAAALVALHLAGVVHGAVDRDHVVVPHRGGAVLVDLYDACRAGSTPRRAAHGAHPAPEQATRAVLAADPASDQYGLATMLAEALGAGGHLADAALAPVIERARASDPAQRYRSVCGLHADLRRYLDEVTARGSCEPFPTGERDIALSWRDPAVAIGRESVLAELEAVVAATAADGLARVVVVRGDEGSGRSTILAALCDQLAERGIITGFGRFSPSGSDPPLRAPIEAMRQVVAHVLAASDATVAAIRDELNARLGADVALATQIIPSMTHLVGRQPAPAESAAEEMLPRVERAVLASVGSIARNAPPLVLVVDDADHADPASIRALRLLGRGDDVASTVTVLAMGTATSAIDATLARVRSDGVPVTTIDVPPLTAADIEVLLARGTGDPSAGLPSLAEAVWHRSAGNPELALADVWTLIDQRRLRVDPEAGQWVWDETALAGVEPTTLEAVAAQRLEALPAAVADIVTAAALCERAATAPVLATALGIDPVDAQHAIAAASTARLLVTRQGIDGAEVSACLDGGVRRAAVARLMAESRTALELRLARALLDLTATEAGGAPQLSDEMRFEVVRLLAANHAALATAAERREFVHLAVDAARAAHRAAGYQLALDLQMLSIEMLGEEGWVSDHESMFDLHIYGAEHALMFGDIARVDMLLAAARAHDPTPQQRVRALRVLSSRWWTRQDTDGAINELRALLAELGEPIPAKPGWLDVGKELVATRVALLNVEPESFLQAPRLTDERVRAAVATMMRCVHLAYISEPLTHVVVSLRGTRLTVRHGVGDGSGYFLTAYAMLSCAFRTDIDRALRFGRVGMQLTEGAGGTIEAMVTFAYNSFVRHWGEPLGVTIEPMIDQYRRTLADRERGYGLTCGSFAVLHSMLASRPLQAVDEMAAEFGDDYERLGEAAFKLRIDIVRQTIHDLRAAPGPSALEGAFFDGPGWLAAKPRRNELALVVHTLRGFIAACYEDRAALQSAVASGAGLLRAAPGQAVVGLHWFLAAMSAAEGACAAGSRRERVRHRGRADKALRWLRTWETHCPETFGHRVALVEAVLAEAAGDVPAAMAGFERAVVAAGQHQALADLGLAAQRAAAFYARTPGSTLLAHYATLAHDAWQAWGAIAAANALVERYPDALVRPTSRGRSPASDTATPATQQLPAATATTGTLAEATLLIGQELEVHEFLGRMLEILLRHAAASRGFLVLQSDRGPRVEAAAHRQGDAIEIAAIASARIDDHPELCLPALSYVLRTREPLALVDPASDRRFRQDERLRDRAPRALLGLPVGRVTGTHGVLMLESDTFTHAFETESIEALTVLANQAISAVENVRLTSDLSALANDVADLRAKAAALTAQAETDPLTGVANRAGLKSGFQAALKALAAGDRAAGDRAAGVRAGGDHGPGSGRQLGVLFIDLDNFKAVNDRRGHSAGDAVLTELAARLRRVVRSQDIVARVGGDEFVILSIDVPTAELTSISDRALQEMSRPLEIDGYTHVGVSASIGVARVALDSLESIDDIDAVLGLADEAMYRAKNEGKNRVAHR